MVKGITRMVYLSTMLLPAPTRRSGERQIIFGLNRTKRLNISASLLPNTSGSGDGLKMVNKKRLKFEKEYIRKKEERGKRLKAVKLISKMNREFKNVVNA